MKEAQTPAIYLSCFLFHLYFHCHRYFSTFEFIVKKGRKIFAKLTHFAVISRKISMYLFVVAITHVEIAAEKKHFIIFCSCVTYVIHLFPLHV